MDIYHSYGVHIHVVCDRYICAIKCVEKHNDDNFQKEEASPSLLECSGMPSGLFPHAGETRGSVVACGMVSGTGVRKEKESNIQMVDPPPCFKLWLVLVLNISLKRSVRSKRKYTFTCSLSLRRSCK